MSRGRLVLTGLGEWDRKEPGGIPSRKKDKTQGREAGGGQWVPAAVRRASD